MFALLVSLSDVFTLISLLVHNLSNNDSFVLLVFASGRIGRSCFRFSTAFLCFYFQNLRLVAEKIKVSISQGPADRQACRTVGRRRRRRREYTIASRLETTFSTFKVVNTGPFGRRTSRTFESTLVTFPAAVSDFPPLWCCVRMLRLSAW